VERGQEFLLPPNMIDWLPEDHLVWFVIDTVAALDTSALHSRAARRRDGKSRTSMAGRASYDPDMLLTLLIYAYACGERSSRRIERLCATDVAFRVICAADAPDHSVLARFRQVHGETFTQLFAQVLRLCRQEGLARLGTVAIDGTKIAANASPLLNRTEQWLRAEAENLDRDSTTRADSADTDGERELARLVLAEADAVDAAEDDQFGTGHDDELPARLRARAGRRERIRAALERIAAEKATEAAEKAASDASRAERDAVALAHAERALRQEIAARHAARDAWEQAWEHAMTNPGAALPKGRAPVAPEQSGSVRRARARLDKARQRVENPDTAPRPGRRRGGRLDHPDNGDPKPEPKANLTDADSTIMPSRRGWVQGYNAQFAITADQIILATAISTNPADVVSYQHMVDQVQRGIADLDATDELGTLLFDAGYASEDTLTAPGPDRLIALGKTHSVRAAARDNPTSGDPPPRATAREAMDHRLRTPEGATLYARRGATVEPGIGNFKKILDRFSQRGLTAVTNEVHLAATAFNLLKIHRAAHS